VRILVASSKAFVSAFLAVIVVMLLFSLFSPHAFRPWVATGIAGGIAMADGVCIWRPLSPNASALLVGVLAATGAAVGTWFSPHI
jgi:hypothetical protein